MKRLRAALAACLATTALAIGAATDGVDGERRFIDAKALAAGSLALNQAYTGLEGTLSPPAELSAQILARPEAHQDPALSQARLRESEAARARGAFERQLAKFALQVPKLPPNWVQATLVRERERLAAAIEESVSSHLGIHFAASRASAVARQRATLELDVLPVPREIEDVALTDLEDLLRGDTASFAARHAQGLADRMVRRAASRGTLLDENARHLSALAMSSVRARLEALERQLGAVRGHNGAGAIERESAAEKIRADIIRLAAAVGEGEDWNGVFDIVLREIETRAETVELAALGATLETWFRDGACDRFLRPYMVEIERSAPAALPAAASAHRERLRQPLAAAAWRAMAEAHTARVTDPARRQRLTDRLVLAARSQQIRGGFDWSFDACLDAGLALARAAAADAELASRAPNIATGRYAFAEPIIGAALDDPRLRPTLAQRARLELEESRERFDEITDDLLDEGVQAMQRQLALVNQADRTAAFRREIEALAPEQRAEEAKQGFLERYREQVAQAWSAARVDTLLPSTEASSDKYLALFERTDAAIEQVITLEWTRAAEQAALDSATASAVPLEETLETEQSEDTLSADCPSPECAQAGRACAEFALACDGTGRCGAAAMALREQCLSLSAACAL